MDLYVPVIPMCISYCVLDVQQIIFIILTLVWFRLIQEHIQRMNKANMEREIEFQALERKLQAMEKLNRHLNEERTKRIQEHQEQKEPQSNGDQ